MAPVVPDFLKPGFAHLVLDRNCRFGLRSAFAFFVV